MSHYYLSADNERTDTPAGKCLSSFQRKLLEKKLQQDLPQAYRQRIEIMLLTDQGQSQKEICQSLGCCRATVRYWMQIARAGIAHQWQDNPIGRPKIADEEYTQRLEELVNHSPRQYGYSFRRWTVNSLNKHLGKELGILVSDRHLKRLLKQLGLSTIAKSHTPKTNTTSQTQATKILITDLDSASLVDDTELFPIKFLDKDTNSGIYGGKTISTVSILATARAYTWSFAF